MANDTEVILNALQKERDALHEQIMQVDRIIKRVKSLEYSSDNSNHHTAQVKENKANKAIETPINIFPKSTDIKIQVLRTFDILRIASKLRDVQDEYTKVSGNKYNIRDSMRTLHASGFLKCIKIRGNNRNFLWAKSEWIENGQLADKHKPDGYDLLYKPDNLVYE